MTEVHEAEEAIGYYMLLFILSIALLCVKASKELRHEHLE